MARDRFIVGDSGGRHYVVHTRYPRFIAELVELLDPSTYGPDAMVLLKSDQVLTRFDWIERPMDHQEVAEIAGAADQFLVDEEQRLMDALPLPDDDD